MNLSYLATLATAPAEPGIRFVDFVPLILIFAIFYFLLIAPMRKRQKAHRQLLSELKKGDRVVTNGGIYGEVTSVEGDTIRLKVSDQVKIKLAKSAVAGFQGEEAEGGATK